MIDMNEIVGTHDILMIVLSSLRYDVAAEMLHAGETPVLARYVGEWTKAHTPGNFTLPAHQAFFTGFLPTPATPGQRTRLFASRFHASETARDSTCTFDEGDIVRGLAGRGYKTVCVGGTGFFSRQSELSSTLPGYFQHQYWTPEFGVTQMHSTFHQVSFLSDWLGRSGNEGLVFAYLNVSATHRPTNIYLDWDELDSLESHAAALQYVDSQLAPLFESFALRRNTFVIVCSDHGTAYGEDGFYGYRVSHPVVMTVPYSHFRLRIRSSLVGPNPQ